MKLVEITQSGDVGDAEHNDILKVVIPATLDLYREQGFVQPWVGYVAIRGDQTVGRCGFKSAPKDDRVEIAYFTFPEFENQGVANFMATELVRIARQTASSVVIVGQTLPKDSASTSILKKLGFKLVGTVDHPDDGLVWEWEL